MLNLDQMLCKLATERPIFHSEADFQHALAWAIHTWMPTASIRLEMPVKVDTSAIHIDLLVRCGAESYPIELKYKTAAMTANVFAEQFSLRNQSAQDCGRYDFLKDVTRLERYVISVQNSIGYAVFLSNDHLYWNEVRKNITSLEFSVHQGRRVSPNARMSWAIHASPDSIKGREAPIVCQFSYSCSWTDYSTIDGRQFKYLLLTVQQPQ